MKKIVKVDYGLASSYDEIIEINKKLKGKLLKKILDHEKTHDNGSYSKKDFLIDFSSKDPYFFESVSFSLKNPEALVNFFPLMYSYYLGIWSLNLTSLFPFLQFGVLFSLFFLIFNINFLSSFFMWSILVGWFNVILIAYTHIYVKYLSKKKI
jgi:hypothetical protein